MTPPKSVVLGALGANHVRDSFECGEPALDLYFRTFASQYTRRRLARVFVAAEPPNGHVIGFYSLSASIFARHHLPSDAGRRLPHYPVPAAILGRFAIDSRFQGQGYGTLVLADAVTRVIQASDILAIYALIVDAKNEDARSFYERFGFLNFVDCRDRLYLPLCTMVKAQGAIRP